MVASPASQLRMGFCPDGWFAALGPSSAPHALSKAASFFLDWLQEGRCTRLLIGYDHTREWKEWIEALASVSRSLSLSCTVGEQPCPLPALAHACREAGAAGLYLTACLTNPEGGLGFRWLAPGGKPLSLGEAQTIARSETCEPALSSVGVVDLRDFTTPYVSWLREQINPRQLRRARLRLLADACGGTTDRILEQVLGDATERINTIYGLPIRHFFHRVPVPCIAEVKELAGQVARGRWSGGIFLSGDGSGLALLNSQGDWIPLAHAAEQAGLHVQWQILGAETDPISDQGTNPTEKQATGKALIAAGNRVQIVGVSPGWDALVAVLVLLGRNPELFTPHAEMPAEKLFIPARGSVTFPMEEDLQMLAQTDWQGEIPSVKIARFLDRPIAALATWKRARCSFAIVEEEAGGGLVLQWLSPERNLLGALEDHVGKLLRLSPISE